MDLHHLRSPGMMLPLQIPTNNGFSWFQSGAGFRPSRAGPHLGDDLERLPGAGGFFSGAVSAPGFWRRGSSQDAGSFKLPFEKQKGVLPKMHPCSKPQAELVGASTHGCGTVLGFRPSFFVRTEQALFEVIKQHSPGPLWYHGVALFRRPVGHFVPFRPGGSLFAARCLDPFASEFGRAMDVPCMSVGQK